MGQEKRNNNQIYTIDGVQYPAVSKILHQVCEPDALMFYACQKLIEKFIQLLQIDNTVFSDSETRKCLDILEALKLSKNAHIEYRDERAEQGKSIHHAFEQHIKGDINLQLDNKTSKIIDNLIAWTKENNVQWVASEKTVCDQWLCYAGTLDAIAIINGVITYIDFKTSKTIYDSHKMQLCAYAFSDKPTGKFQCLIIQINTETCEITGHYIKNSEITHKYNSFLHLLSYFYSIKARRINNHRAKSRS